MILSKINKTIGLLRNLRNILPRSALLAIYKALLGPTLIMAILYMTKLTMDLFIESSNLLNGGHV